MGWASTAYSGRREGCTLRPPYFAAWMRRRGTKSPNDTAMMRLMGTPSGLGICEILIILSKQTVSKREAYIPASEGISLMNG